MEFTQSYKEYRQSPLHEIHLILTHGEGFTHQTVVTMAKSALMAMGAFCNEPEMLKEFGEEHPFYVDYWVLKAILMAFEDRFDEAEALAGKAYELGVRTLGEKDSDTQRAKQLKHNIATMGSPFEMTRELMRGQTKLKETSTAAWLLALDNVRNILNNPEEAKKWGIDDLILFRNRNRNNFV